MVLMAIDHRDAALPVPERGFAPPEAEAGTPRRQASLWKDALHRFTRNRGAVVAAAVFAVIVLYCLLEPIFSPYDPNEVVFAQAYLPASWDHPFGTDKFGRDLFTRAAIGGRISIGIGFAGTFAILAIGLVYGSIAGFVGRLVDDVLMRFLDALYGLPYLPFAIITTQILSPSGAAGFWTMSRLSRWPAGLRLPASCAGRSRQ
jgi:ABC-type dipeptide/oligopeptide/nickel transport system permease subunit